MSSNWSIHMIYIKIPLQSIHSSSICLYWSNSSIVEWFELKSCSDCIIKYRNLISTKSNIWLFSIFIIIKKRKNCLVGKLFNCCVCTLVMIMSSSHHLLDSTRIATFCTNSPSLLNGHLNWVRNCLDLIHNFHHHHHHIMFASYPISTPSNLRLVLSHEYNVKMFVDRN